MTWFYLTLLSAVTWSFADAISKQLSDDISDFTNVWIRFIYGTPFFLLLWFIIDIPSLTSTFWWAMIAVIPLEILTWILYLRAIRLSPLSLTVPLLGLTPVFLLVVPWILMGEHVSLTGGLGVMVIAIGIYVLNIHTSERGALEPFRSIRNEPGSQLMILVALLFSVTATLGKIIIVNSSPLFMAAFFYPVIALIMAPYALSRSQIRREALRFPWKALLLGIIFASMALAHYFAIEIAKVAYMVAVKRTSLIFSTVLGFLFFREKDIGSRLAGTVIIVAGVFLVVMG